MFDIGWSELLIIGIVALIVVGPKDLPGMFRTLGRFTGKARGMARDFQRAMEQAADDSGVKDMAKEFRDAARPGDFGTDDLKSFTKNPKAWARDAARKSVLSPEEADEMADPAAAPPSEPAPTRGPATEALAKAKADATAARRAEVDASRAAAAESPDDGAPGGSGGGIDTQPTDRP